MHYLHIKAWPSSSQNDSRKKRFDVTWSDKLNGDNLVHLDITVPCKTYSPVALAELYLAHYCICNKAIFNQNYSGSHLQIAFGSDQTIDLIEQGLNPYLMMTVFRTRFRGCKLYKGERYSHFPSNFEHEENLIFSSMPLDIIETKVMGDLRLTQHAYDRFWERCVPEHDAYSAESDHP